MVSISSECDRIVTAWKKLYRTTDGGMKDLTMEELSYQYEMRNEVDDRRQLILPKFSGIARWRFETDFMKRNGRSCTWCSL